MLGPIALRIALPVPGGSVVLKPAGIIDCVMKVFTQATSALRVSCGSGEFKEPVVARFQDHDTRSRCATGTGFGRAELYSDRTGSALGR